MTRSKLSRRQEQVLASLIELYMVQASPVGSARLRQQIHLPWSTATLRHEMAILEEAGYLGHSHTSAGRYPTAFGLRYYVDHLLEAQEIAPSLREHILEELASAETEPVRLAFTVSQLLSRYSRQMSLVHSEAHGQRNFIVTGQEHFLGEPEFNDSLKLKDLFRVLAEEEVQAGLLRPVPTQTGVHVRIGREAVAPPYQELFEDVAVAYSSFGGFGTARGAIGIMGPKRMNYRELIPLVAFTVVSMDRELKEHS